MLWQTRNTRNVATKACTECCTHWCFATAFVDRFNNSLCRYLWHLLSRRVLTFVGRSSPEEEVCRQTPRSAAPSRRE